jgi:hypothetical protein
VKEAVIAGICLALLLILSGCQTYSPVNLDFCTKDSEIGAPTHEFCDFDISNQTFEIGTDSKTGQQDLYTQYGQSLTADEYDKDAIRLSPWAFAAFRKNILSWCHDHANACNYPTVVETFKRLENSLKINRSVVPEWTDEMLGEHEPQK